MKSLKKIVAALFVFGFLFALASCSGYNFYNDFKKAGATIDTDHQFVVMSIDEAKAKKGSEEFSIIIGNSNKEECVTAISKMYDEFKTINFAGTVNYINVKGLTLTERNDATKVLGTDVDSSDGIIFVAYKKDGTIKFNTSNSTDLDAKKFRVDGSLAYRAIADYIAETYTK